MQTQASNSPHALNVPSEGSKPTLPTFAPLGACRPVEVYVYRGRVLEAIWEAATAAAAWRHAVRDCNAALWMSSPILPCLTHGASGKHCGCALRRNVPAGRFLVDELGPCFVRGPYTVRGRVVS